MTSRLTDLCRARLGITNWLISHGIASVEEVRSPSGELINAYARVDKALVLSQGKEVMGKLLLEIQVRKSIGDGKGATGQLPPSSYLSFFMKTQDESDGSLLQEAHDARKELDRRPAPTRPRQKGERLDSCGPLRKWSFAKSS